VRTRDEPRNTRKTRKEEEKNIVADKCGKQASAVFRIIWWKHTWGLCPQTPGIYRFHANPGAKDDRNDHPAVLLLITIAPGLARKR
jgi:hypothetical protein